MEKKKQISIGEINGNRIEIRINHINQNQSK